MCRTVGVILTESGMHPMDDPCVPQMCVCVRLAGLWAVGVKQNADGRFAVQAHGPHPVAHSRFEDGVHASDAGPQNGWPQENICVGLCHSVVSVRPGDSCQSKGCSTSLPVSYSCSGSAEWWRLGRLAHWRGCLFAQLVLHHMMHWLCGLLI